ncbi:2-oxoacid:acceptor oxidoreductase family protein [Desulfurococcaceae archaeon MEX13E-LK6-19]|nr:2-oxoacid:acceptor oxidoreductase family protein [Desulfurococcaceae archaeon MEX13E-LK6-19]
MLIEVRWHGRGGQGAWTASNLLAMAVALAGKHTQSFPAFGPERSGAPVLAFTRISDEPIEIHSMIYNPDIVVVLDPTLLASVNVVAGLKKGGLIVINYEGEKDKLFKLLGIQPGEYKVWTVPASKLALDILKRNITNTAMIGALVKAANLVDLDNVFKAIKERFPEPVAEKNIELVKKAYEEAREV